MMANNIRTIKANSTRTTAYQNQHTIRNFNFLIDIPHALGGENKAATPTEYLLSSLNGCLMIVMEMVAKERQLTIQSLTIDSEATSDRRGMLGTANVQPYFLTVDLYITLTVKEDIDIEEFIELSLSRCPTYNLINDSQTKINIHI
ncbi:OsmC family protein [Amphibacillus cookii]|uniref:OsmC family protein n=1 Tax=Amphibacillus cookii TaxID=767787 RepID=UPI0019597CF0|nr:OsmC family protein [Amphibacillus cookii]MBM7541046.1 putative OsmC-like protein [Amphibacillus cookii]